ncbi:MAG: nicotinate phosphoribosyltransferase [Actinomycetota bacterium]|nr:nicotinate phosphoribosyltransferase [Actinomycetota bacterium]
MVAGPRRTVDAGGGATASTALLTDQYELTMVDAALRSGIAGHRAVFEIFARRLPPGRRYGVVAGLGRLVEAIQAFRFGEEELRFLEGLGLFSGELLAWAAGYRFGGSIDGYREGELFFAESPVLTVESTFAEAIVLETLALSVLNFDSAVASAAARMDVAAGPRTLVEMGGRRANEHAAVAAARAAYLSGFDASSNLEARRSWGVPSLGTASHAFTLGHPDETAAFRAQAAVLGPGSTFLVDTFDVAEGIRRAVEVAGADRLGAVRIDSGDLVEEIPLARAILDDLGATRTKIVATGDLDEHRISALAALPVDAFGVGTSLVTGSGAPTAEFIYKLVAVADRPGDHVPLRPVAKRSPGKSSTGGRKVAWRILDELGFAQREQLQPWPDGGQPELSPGLRARALQVAVMRSGEVVHQPSLDAVRTHHLAARAELRPQHLAVDPGPPALTPISTGGETR